MFITGLRLKNFRCFPDLEIAFDKKFVILEGDNGSGKSTILEALYYACYLKSFRTRSKSELLKFGQDHFFLQVDFEDQLDFSKNQIQVGFSKKEDFVIKFNGKNVSSFKELVSRYKIISLTEDDLQLVVGAPEFRRAYLNQSLFLLNPDVILEFKEYKIMVLPDHYTCVESRTHASDAVPFLIYESRQNKKGPKKFCERSAASSGTLIERGYKLMDIFIKGKDTTSSFRAQREISS